MQGGVCLLAAPDHIPADWIVPSGTQAADVPVDGHDALEGPTDVGASDTTDAPSGADSQPGDTGSPADSGARDGGDGTDDLDAATRGREGIGVGLHQATSTIERSTGPTMTVA